MDKALNVDAGRAGFLSFALLCFAILVFFAIAILGRARERKRVEGLQARMEREVALLQRRQSELMWQKQRLLSDPVFIEGEIRRQLGFRRPGEIAYTRVPLPVRHARSPKGNHRFLFSSIVSSVHRAVRRWREPIVLALVLSIFGLTLFSGRNGLPSHR